MAMFIKFDGIEGEATHRDHRGEISIDSFNWGHTNPTTVGGGGGGSSSKASPVLALKCASGQHIKEAVLTVRKAGGRKGEPYMTIVLKDVIISSFEQSSDGGSSAAEQLSLNFTKIEYKHFYEDADGSVKSTTFTWDIKKNTP
jgi:type VI secretion system secreted protein Hcp